MYSLSGNDVVKVFVCLCMLRNGITGTEPYMCHGTVCNRDAESQFCQSDFPYCRACAYVQDDCQTNRFPQNCTGFCVDYLVKQTMYIESQKDCPALPTIVNGTFSNGGPHNLGNAVLASCDPGFTLLGHSTLTCVEYGQWDHTYPTCKAVSCPCPPTLKNGHWRIGQTIGCLMEHFNPSTNAEFICEIGQMDGTTSWRCSLNGTWLPDESSADHVLPYCKESGSSLTYLLVGIASFLGIICAGFIVKYIVDCIRQKYKKQKANEYSPDVESQTTEPLLGETKKDSEHVRMETELKENIIPDKQNVAVQTEDMQIEYTHHDESELTHHDVIVQPNEPPKDSPTPERPLNVNVTVHLNDTREHTDTSDDEDEDRSPCTPDEVSTNITVDNSSKPVQETVQEETATKEKIMQFSNGITADIPTAVQVIPSGPSNSEVLG